MQIEVLWDASPLWGGLLYNALRQVVPEQFFVSRGEDIARRGVRGDILLVPGGSARHKLQALGAAGIAAVRGFVAEGGTYLGFCGGAGLALSDNLGLCPWGRSKMRDKMQHLVSGHIISSIAEGEFCPEGCRQGLLPVWWPGRFEESSQIPKVFGQDAALFGNVRVLARYQAAGADLYVGDLPVHDIPQQDLDDWNNLYGVDIRPTLLDGQPAAVSGRYGKGYYLLSYSHFETPESPDANAFLYTALRGLACRAGCEDTISALTSISDPLCSSLPDSPLTEEFWKFEQLFALGVNLGLLFRRRPWLFGWRSAIPGSQLNALRLALHQAAFLNCNVFETTQNRLNFEKFCTLSALFRQGARSWFLAKRLAESLGDSSIVSREILTAQRHELFGPPMVGGGLCGELTDILDNFFLLDFAGKD